MRFSALLVKLSLGIAIIVLGNSALFAQDAELVRHFDYDATAPAPVFLQYATQEPFLTLERAREYEKVVIDAIPDLYQPPRPN
jgi:hypothetical protein